jgi:hypothetical protein
MKEKVNRRVNSFKFNVPSAPYINEEPNKNKHDMKEPEMKYLRPASEEEEEFRLKQANV